MTRLDSNVYKTFVKFFKFPVFFWVMFSWRIFIWSTEQDENLHFLANFTNEIYHYKNFFYETMEQFFYETNFLWNHFFFSEQKNCQSSFTSFTTYSTLATTILKLLHGPSESARVFGDPIYARGKARAKKTSA